MSCEREPEIVLVRPAMDYAEEIMRYRREFLEAGDSLDGCGSLRERDTAADWLDDLARLESEETCPEGWVCSTTRLALRRADGRLVGVIDLRHHIDHPGLSLWGGHIGYSTRPSERGKGYATEALRQTLQTCRALGIERALVTCDAENAASAKVILRNGGMFEKEIAADGRRVRRYWIETPT